MKLVPTEQQLKCIELAKAGNLKIEAGAGAAKSSTLGMIANELVTPSIYLVFNKKLAEDAQDKFPEHVEICTTHSLAYRSFGADLRNKLTRPRGAYVNVAGTGTEIASFFKVKDFGGEFVTVSKAAIGLCIKQTLARYEQSSAEEISENLIPFESICNRGEALHEHEKKVLKRDILRIAEKMWELRIDPDSPVLANHNTYLKLYQLSKPDLSQYEVIYLDESQDLNPCTLDIVLSQKNSKIISVGDSYQAIYMWNGSINALESLNYALGKLSMSFRFGQAIADVANIVLGVDWVKGYDKVASAVFNDEFAIPTTDFAYLFRTNSGLVFEAMEQIGKGVRVNIEMDTKDFTEMLWSIVALRKGDDRSKVKHPDIIPFANFADFLEESEHNPDFKRSLNILKNNDWYKMLQTVTNHKNTHEPDIILTTAHKSKGREFNTVVLANDFPDIYDKNGVLIDLEDEERNLLYVALTRAKHKLYINKTIQNIIECSIGE
jgi:hypothetical protein